MKRSKTTALLLMSAAPLLLTACQRTDAVQVQEGLYTSVQACTEATQNPSACRQAFEAAQAQSAESAPQYASREACARDYPAEHCVEQRTVAGQSFVGPMMMGFFMAQMLNGNRPVQGQAPQAAPAYQSRNRGWATPELRPGPGSAQAAGGNRLTPVTTEPNRAVTASRGGFGTTSRNRSTSGG